MGHFVGHFVGRYMGYFVKGEAKDHSKDGDVKSRRRTGGGAEGARGDRTPARAADIKGRWPAWK